MTSIELPATLTIGEYAFSETTGLTSVVIPSVHTIGSNAFSNTPLTYVEMPAAVTIGNYAFAGTDLTEVEMPEATSIGEYAFQRCSNLLNVSMPKVESIGKLAFNECYGLTAIVLPASLKHIADFAFNHCENVTDVVIADGEDYLEMGYSPFDYCPLTKLIIGRNLINYENAHICYNMNSLEMVWFTDAVTEIPLLLYESTVKNVYFGANVEQLNGNIFMMCKELNDIYAFGMLPPTIDENWAGVDWLPFSRCTLHYPAGAPYDIVEPWSLFENKTTVFGVTMEEETLEVAHGTTATITITTDTDVEPTEIVWMSSNPMVAEIVADTEAKPTRGTTFSTQVLIKENLPVNIAAFLPNGQMGFCTINPLGNGSVENLTSIYATADVFSVYNMQGMLVLRTNYREELNSLTPGFYIVNGRKHLVTK